MARRRGLMVLLLAVSSAAVQARALGPRDVAAAQPLGPHSTEALRKQLQWGVATAAYQVEGAWNEGGRSPSVWDTFAHVPGNIKNNDTGDVACDMYHKYPEDFALMKELGVKHYRFSFSWSRVLPQGVAGSPVNPEGIKFYNDLIDSMLANGVTPYATIFHWDLPQVLQDKYRGFLSPQIIDDYVYYAGVLFQHFGDRVKAWMTFNEPWITCVLQWGQGDFAPGINNGEAGQYACGHHLLLAHAQAKALYDAKFAVAQAGVVGIALNIEYMEPLTPAPADVAAAQFGLEKNLGWFADPLYFGDYPASLKAAAGPLLPAFTPEQKALLQGSLDFFGLNFYTAKFVRGDPANPFSVETLEYDAKGRQIGALAESVWLRVVPWGIYKQLMWIHDRYAPAAIVISENGVSGPGEASMAAADALNDTFRLKYYAGYIDNVLKAVTEGVAVKTYFAWSFLDNFEWRQGYSERFGITHVDFSSPQRTRTVKASGRWLSQHFFKVGQ